MPAKKATASKSTAKKRKSTTAKKATSPKARATSTKGKAKAKTNPKAKAKTKASTTAKTKTKSKVGDQEVTIDRRRKADRRDEATEVAATAKLPKRREKVQRRRQIDPTTCERDYSEPEVEFMNAMENYKRTSGRMFPTCSEVLEVIRNLGYVQLTPAEIAVVRPEPVEELKSTEKVSEEESEDFDDVDLDEADLTF